MAVERASPSALSHFDPADLLDALSTGIIMLDAQLCPVYANVAAQDLLAFSLNMARGRPFVDFLHDAEGLCRILKRALQTGEGIADRELAVRPAGAPREVRTLDVTITPLTGLTGTHLLLELADTPQRQRLTRENDLLARSDARRRMVEPLQGVAAGPRDQNPARRAARRGAAAGARAAGGGAQGIHSVHHRRSRPPHRTRRLHVRTEPRAEQERAQRSRDL